jgi:16S rRNA (guanine527-N7)-methyltransferase
VSTRLHAGWRPEKALIQGAEALDVALEPVQIQQLVRYLDLLGRWGAVFNLSAVSEVRDVVTRHLLDSLAVVAPIARWAAGRPLRILDVGSGAGLPGLVIAIARPDWRVTTIDAAAKKVAFVRQSVGELKLDNVDVVHGRVESIMQPRTAFNLIISRAFASLREIVELTARQLAPGGAWVAMKGRHPNAEIRELPQGVEAFHVEQLAVPGIDAARCLVWIRPH